MERFETVFENSLLGNKIISSELNILQVNPALVALLGYETKDEIIGTKILDYAPAHCHKDWKVLQDKLWQKQTPSFSLETCLVKKDKTMIWCKVTSLLFSDKGETLGYTIIEDITEQYNVKLQKEEFLNVASHELRTPITSLKATVQLLNRVLHTSPPDIDKLIKLANNAERFSGKLTHLVDDLMDATKMDHGQFALNKTDFTLSDVIDGCCSHIRLEGKYQITYEGNHTLKVYADQHKIDQVLVNLVNNAVKYAPDSPEIIIRVEKIKDYTKILIIDKGQGILPENMAHLFERYYRIDEEGSHTSGIGIGLYICSEIIKRHEGKIGVDSIIGKGSDFWFTLPDLNPQTEPLMLK
jgi:PAS domain S-box-containing protein